MPRTPLFRLLRRSFRLAQHSVATGRPAGEVVEEWRESAGLTRRQLLGSTAAAAGLALAGCRPFAAPARTGESGTTGPVIIVGGGIAGLTAAYRLMQRDIPVRVFEAQDRSGGRMYSQPDFLPGQVIELGGELVDTQHFYIRRLAEELGIGMDDFVFDDPDLRRDVFFFDGRQVDEHAVVEAFVPVSWRMVQDLASLDGGFVSYREPNGGEKLDRTPLSLWLDAFGLDPWFRKLLDVAYTTEYGLETAEQSALNLLLLMDPNPMPFRIFGISDERFHVKGGNDRIPKALAERLGGRIETGTQVEQVAKRADGSFTVTFRRGGRSEVATAEHVVIATPFTMLRPREDGGAFLRLDDSLGIPEVQKRAIRELGYGTNSKLMVGFQRKVWRRPEPRYRSNGSSLTDLPYQLCWETSRLQPGETGILTNFSGGRRGLEVGEGTPEERAAEFAGWVDQVFPGAAEARIEGKQARFLWPRFPWTLGSYACYRPGQWTAFSGEEGRRVGNLHFIGEHTSEGAQGFMEGGCETGERAARDILAGEGTAAIVPFPRRARLAALAQEARAVTASRVG